MPALLLQPGAGSTGPARGWTPAGLGRLPDAVLGVFGHERRWIGDTGAGYGTHDQLGTNTFWLTKPIDGQPASVGNGTNVAFTAPGRRAVREFYEKALTPSGKSEGELGIREGAHDHFYAGYVRDLNGHKIVAELSRAAYLGALAETYREAGQGAGLSWGRCPGRLGPCFDSRGGEPWQYERSTTAT